MRYLMMVKGDENFRASGPPPKSLMDAIDQLGAAATKDGTLVSVGGLQHSSKGATMRLEGGKLTVRDGPFTEAKEVIGGFSIFELPSREAAIAQARKFMELHRQHWPGWDGECEIREMYGENDGP